MLRDKLSIEQYEQFCEIRTIVSDKEAKPEGAFWFFEDAETES